jgi:DNA-binding LacI/PurR family transcriptional regulator
MLLKCTYGSVEAENQAIENAVEIGAEGLILMCAQNETYNTAIVKRALEKFPMVLVDRTMQGIPIPCVKTDNYMAAKEMTRLLIERGHHNLCFVTHSSINTPTIRERHEGFVDCILEYDGVNGKTMQISEYNPTPEEAKEPTLTFNREEIRKLLLEHQECTAFLCIETKLCSILCEEMAEMGLKREIVSFDGRGSSGSKNVIAYVKQGEREMGIAAVDSLEQIMNGTAVTGEICIPYQIRTM